ncbi:MAG: 23S rRNA (uracil(1939)-C(5))-methyltransferase RlmD [Epulopiscium sp.]|mgnify:CR=1 FL=1|nr:23S rRNA (uracil(1939)-C(5))-methyltransferase RlmD [Candidatus Epulonipiscium sp.]
MKKAKRQVPVSKNKNYTIKIHDLGARSEGIGKIEDFTIFVDKALPGDLVEVSIVHIRKNFAFGKIIKIIEPSPYRREAKCQVADKCGGCQLQHFTYEGQLEYKRKKVKDSLERIGKIEDVRVNPVIGMETPYFYRNKAQFPVAKKDGKVEIGFYAPRSHNIVDTDTCDIQHESNTEIIKIVRDFLEENDISIYDEVKHKGLVRHILTKVGFKTGEIMVCLVINGESLPYSDKLVNKLRLVDGVTSIALNHNKKKGNVILGPRVTNLHGKNYIRDYIDDIQFEISPLSFFQVNPIQTEILYEKVLEYAQLSGDEIVWDAYCGIGSISLFLAKKAKKVYGVEVIKQAIEDARRNAKINKIENAEFIVGLAEEVIPEKFEKEGIKSDVIVVDPPRKGCDESLLATIVEMHPKRLVYVSCDPGTLARDLKYLTEKGFKVREVQPVDLFPQTGHVECVVLMEQE